jgi:5-methylthioadenosine/S-adenosylhomocysteine deaminase
MPGLINTHTHAAMTLLRGYADDMPLMPWLEEKVWPFEAKMTEEDIYWGSALALGEMIRSGTTTMVDMYIAQEQTGRAVLEAGTRAVLSTRHDRFRTGSRRKIPPGKRRIIQGLA